MEMSSDGGSDGKESTCNAGGQGSIPGSERCPGEGNGYLFQYSFWRIPRTEYFNPWGSKESEQLSDEHFHYFFFHTMKVCKYERAWQKFLEDQFYSK